MRDNAPDKLVVVDLPVPAHQHERVSSAVHKAKPSTEKLLTYTVATPFNSSSTSASDIFSPNWVNTYRNSPAPMRPLPVLSNTWNPLMNSSARVEDGNGFRGGFYEFESASPIKTRDLVRMGRNSRAYLRSRRVSNHQAG